MICSKPVKAPHIKKTLMQMPVKALLLHKELGINAGLTRFHYYCWKFEAKPMDSIVPFAELHQSSLRLNIKSLTLWVAEVQSVHQQLIDDPSIRRGRMISNLDLEGTDNGGARLYS